VECITNETGLSRKASETRHLSIGSYAASWNPYHDLVDAKVQTLGCEAWHQAALTPGPGHLIEATTESVSATAITPSEM
jgi:hypothetical protein